MPIRLDHNPAGQKVPFEVLSQVRIPSLFDKSEPDDDLDWAEAYEAFGIDSPTVLAALVGFEEREVRKYFAPEMRVYARAHRIKAKRGEGALAAEAFSVLRSGMVRVGRRLWYRQERRLGSWQLSIKLAEIHCPRTTGSKASLSVSGSESEALSFEVRFLSLGLGGGLVTRVAAGHGLMVSDGECHSIVAEWDADVFRYALRVLGKKRKEGIRIVPTVLRTVRYERLPEAGESGHACELKASDVQRLTGRAPVKIDMTASSSTARSSTSFDWSAEDRLHGGVTLTLPWGVAGYRSSIETASDVRFAYDCAGGHFYAFYSGEGPDSGYLWTTKD